MEPMPSLKLFVTSSAMPGDKKKKTGLLLFCSRREFAE
jgi:hypothetical protein